MINLIKLKCTFSGIIYIEDFCQGFYPTLKEIDFSNNKLINIPKLKIVNV